MKRATIRLLATLGYIVGSMTGAAVTALSALVPHTDGSGWHHLFEPITFLSMFGTGAVTFASRMTMGEKELADDSTMEKKLPKPIPAEELKEWR